jgi:hypothetical protein
MEIFVSKILFNNGREDFVNNTTPSILYYGAVPVMPPVVTKPEIIILPDHSILPLPSLVSTSSEPITTIIPETIPVVIAPVVSDTPVSDTPPPVIEMNIPSVIDTSTLPSENESSFGTEVPPVTL